MARTLPDQLVCWLTLMRPHAFTQRWQGARTAGREHLEEVEAAAAAEGQPLASVGREAGTARHGTQQEKPVQLRPNKFVMHDRVANTKTAMFSLDVAETF